MHLYKNSGIMFILLITAISGCYKDEHAVDFTSSEISRLISGDTAKTWVTVRLIRNGSEQTGDPCSANLIKKFTSSSLQPTPLYEVYKNPTVCEGIDTLLQRGTWYVIEGFSGAGSEDTLALILSGDTLKFGIDEITSTRLSLSGKADNSMLEEDLEWYSQ